MRVSKYKIAIISVFSLAAVIYSSGAISQPASMQPGYKNNAPIEYINNQDTNYYDSEGNVVNPFSPTMPVKGIVVNRTTLPEKETKRRYFINEKDIPLSPSSSDDKAAAPSSMQQKSDSKTSGDKKVIIEEVPTLKNKDELNWLPINTNDGDNKTAEPEAKKKSEGQRPEGRKPEEQNSESQPVQPEIKNINSGDEASLKNAFFVSSVFTDKPSVEVTSVEESFAVAQAYNLQSQNNSQIPTFLRKKTATATTTTSNVDTSPYLRPPVRTQQAQQWQPAAPIITPNNAAPQVSLNPTSNTASVTVKPIKINDDLSAVTVAADESNDVLQDPRTINVKDQKIIPIPDDIQMGNIPPSSGNPAEMRRPVYSNGMPANSAQQNFRQSPSVAAKPVYMQQTPPPAFTDNLANVPQGINPAGKVMGGMGFMNTANSLPTQDMNYFLEEAYVKNPELKGLRDAIKAADESVPQAFAGFLPKLDLNFSNSLTKASDGSQNKDTFYPDTQSLELNQSLFGGGETYYQIKAAKDRVMSARYELKSEEQRFMRQAIEAYVNVIYAKKVLTLNQKNEKVLTDQVKSTRERFVIGDATKTDVAQSEARLANSVSSRISAENDYVNAKSVFRRIFLVDAPENITMPTNLPDIPKSLDEALNTAVNSSPEIQRNLFAKNQRDSEVEVQRSQLYPQVDVTGSTSKRESVSGNTLFNNEQDAITLNVRVPLYDSGITYSRTREAKNRRGQSEFEYQNSVITTRDKVIQAWQSLATAALNIESTKASILAAEYAIEGVREEQKEGQRTVFDVLLAEQDRFNAEVSHARAIKDSVLAVYNLKESVGQLSPSDLGLSVANYDPAEHYDNTKFKVIGF